MIGAVLDSHHHLWDTAELEYPLFRNLPALAQPYRASDHVGEAEQLGITASICVEAASAGADPLRETDWLLAEADRSSVVAGVVAWAPLDRPAELESHLDRLLAHPGKPVLGVRRSFEQEEPVFPRRPEIAAGARLAGERGLVVDLVLFSPSLGATIDLVDACEGTQFVLDHLGKPRIREGLLEPWSTELRELAARPNVVAKVSGLSTEADHAAWRLDDLRPYVEHALSCFGAERLLYGSDWPVVELAGGHGRWLGVAGDLLAGLSEEDQSAIFRENARRVYALDDRVAGQPTS
jgi:L-fuconolactonase